MKIQIIGILSIPLLLGALGGCAGLTDNRPPPDSPRQRAMAARVEAVGDARSSLEAAKTAGCELSASYEYYMAKEYLTLAERELVEGDPVGALEFAGKSKTHSAKAIETTKGGAKQ